MKEFLIKIWDSEEDREQGISDIIETGITELSEAIKRAKRIFENESFSCVEVQDQDETETFFMKDSSEERVFYNTTQESNKTLKNKLYNKTQAMYKALINEEDINNPKTEEYKKANKEYSDTLQECAENNISTETTDEIIGQAKKDLKGEISEDLISSNTINQNNLDEEIE